MPAYTTVSPMKVTNRQRSRSESSPTNASLPNELIQILNDIKSKGRNQRDHDGPRKISPRGSLIG